MRKRALKKWFSFTLKQRLKKQLRQLKKLRMTKQHKLWRIHDKKFKGTKWYIRLHINTSHNVLVRRLFCLYCWRWPIYPPESELHHVVRDALDSKMSPANLAAMRKDDEARAKIREFERFSRPAIRIMQASDVDRYLAALNIALPESSLAARKQVLWELFNKPQKDLIALNNRRNRRVRQRRSKIGIRATLRDLILQNPDMDFVGFRNTFGHLLPTISPGVFRVVRCNLRKAGYDIPKFPPGPRQPAIRFGEANWD